MVGVWGSVWVGVKAILRITHSNQKIVWRVDGWVVLWVSVWLGVKAILRIAYSNKKMNETETVAKNNR